RDRPTPRKRGDRGPDGERQRRYGNEDVPGLAPRLRHRREERPHGRCDDPDGNECRLPRGGSRNRLAEELHEPDGGGEHGDGITAPPNPQPEWHRGGGGGGAPGGRG